MSNLSYWHGNVGQIKGKIAEVDRFSGRFLLGCIQNMIQTVTNVERYRGFASHAVAAVFAAVFLLPRAVFNHFY